MTNRADVASLSDADLLDAQRGIALRRRELDVEAALIAGEIDRRSAREFGHGGLAQRAGFLSAEALIQSVTGGSRVEAARLVAVGSSLDSPVGVAVLDGSISVDAAAAIKRGLGSTGAEAAPLLQQAAGLDADQLYKRARDLRDELDALSVARREKEQRDLRYLRYSTREDGMLRGSFLLDAVDGALVTSALDAVLSPRRGGPRFVSPEQAARDDALLDDPRTTEQIAADSLVAMMRLAVDADPGTLFGSRRPAVRLVLTSSGASLEDSGEHVSTATAERFICDAGVIPAISTTTASASTSVAPSGCSPSGSGLGSPCVTADAAFPAVIARHPGARPTTSTSGTATTGAPTLPTEFCCVDGITCSCTTITGRSVAMVPRTRLPPRAARYRQCHQCRCPRRAACSKNGRDSCGGAVCPKAGCAVRRARNTPVARRK
jgi:hypothetical protein